MSLRRSPVALAAIGLVVLVVLIGAPLVGWPRVVRLPAVLVPALAFMISLKTRKFSADGAMLVSGGRDIRVFEETASTNDVIEKLAQI